MTLPKIRVRACEFQIEKNAVVSALYESELSWEQAAEIEALLCETVNKFMDDAFPGWRDRETVERWHGEAQSVEVTR